MTIAAQFSSFHKTEVIRLDEEPVSKTGAGASPLWVQVPRLPLRGWPTTKVVQGQSEKKQQKTCASGRAAKVPGFHPGQAGSTPARHSFKKWVGSSAAERSPVKRQRAGSSPARPSSRGCPTANSGEREKRITRRVVCWLTDVALNHVHAGSIPALAMGNLKYPCGIVQWQDAAL